MPDTSTPLKARDHARSMAGTVVESMPVIPASAAKGLPHGVNAGDVLWDETLGAGAYAARRLKRGSRLMLTNIKGDACASFVVLNAERPIERLNVADTVKVQWNAYLGPGKLLLSDMGRVLMSILEATPRASDTFCGCSSAASNAAKYGQGDNHSPFPSARDRLLLALAKFGLTKRDLPPCVSFFKGVRIEADGSTTFLPDVSPPGDHVTLRAEMDVLVTVANCPHPLDDRPEYHATPLRLLAWRGPVTGASDALRNASPESLRAFQNTEDYCNT